MSLAGDPKAAVERASGSYRRAVREDVATRAPPLAGHGRAYDAMERGGVAPLPDPPAAERRPDGATGVRVHDGVSPSPGCIPVRTLDRIVIVRVAAIVRLEADDNYVRIWTDRMHLHKETLASLCARLGPRDFVRIHRSHAVRIDCVRELVPRLHGEYRVRLSSGVS